ncbi:MAG TPA: hypothetical protein VNN76_08225 [Bacteroidota bacterium]|nr:hypothetical protein [Bacteroidota bacterium]
MRYDARFFSLCALLVISVTMVCAQPSELSISAEIDTLTARLLENPNNAALQTQLIDLYLQTFNPELALLEISYAEALNQLGGIGTMMKGRVQASLEQISPAIKTLQLAYLQSPNDEALMLLGILEYSRGNTGAGGRILKRLAKRLPSLSVELLKQYEKFYLNGRRVIARGIATALQDTDPVSYATYFPLPEISILSPADNFSTEASQTSVIFEVKHRRPIQQITLGKRTVFDRGEEKVASVTEEYLQSFSQLADISEGKNVLTIKATDVFGYSSERSVIVNGMSFSRIAGWASPSSDSLKKEYLTLRSYIPEPDLLAQKNQAVRVLVISATTGADSTQYFDRGLFLYDFLTHPYSGISAPANAKILLGPRVSAQNIAVISDEWLIRSATFQSVTILYIAGRWEVSQEGWNYFDSMSQKVDFKPILEKLAQLATAGVVMICDGVINDRVTLEEGLRAIAQTSTIPINAVVLRGDDTWVTGTLRDVTQVKSTAMTAQAELFSLYDIALKAGATVISKEPAGLVIAQNPARKIGYQYQEMLVQLEKKLGTDKAQTSARQKILAFARDWRRFNEVRRYLQNDLSLADFIVRAEEFLSRSEYETK